VTRHPRLVDAGWSLVLALAVVGPLWLGRGFWLVGDMVFVPHQPWKDAWLGLDGSLPRAVPMDAILSVVGHVVPGELQQRLLLTGGLLLGGIGVGRVVGRASTPARAAAIALFVWNPWVAEHLAIGQWAILLGYLALPWVALAARRLRADPHDGGPAAVALVVSAVCSPSSGVMAAVTLAVLGLDRRTWWRVVAIATTANLTWLVPAITATTATTATVTTDGVFRAFAARAESPAGVLASLLSLGGTWKTSIVPGTRTSTVMVLLACLLTAAAALGLRRAECGERNERRRLVALGSLALATALLPTVPAGADVLDAAAGHLPGLALVRDSHRFLAPLGLVLAIGVAGAADTVVEGVRPGREALRAVAALLVVAPVLLLPDLAWGLGGDLARASYPVGWTAVADRIAHDPGTTVVLPWTGSYRGFDWDHGRAVLDPAPRFLPGDVLVDDRTLLADSVVPAEDPRSEPVRSALAAPRPVDALRGLGVRWVLVEEGNGAGPAAQRLRRDGATTAYAGDGLVLLDLGPGQARNDHVSVVHRDQIVAGHLAVLLLLVLGSVAILRSQGVTRVTGGSP
jgi:hypothetical protein